MSATDTRVAKLYPALAARERAVLVLKAWKDGERENPLTRRTMPSQQADEFNRFIDLMNNCNGHLATLILLTGAEVKELGTRSGWFATLLLWEVQAQELGWYLFRHTKEPITESEHAERLEAARAEMVPVADLAEELAEYECPQPESDEVWEKVVSAKRRELGRLVSEGVLTGTGKGSRLRINAGSFYDWSGKPVPVLVDWGLEFDVLPDDQAEMVAKLREERAQASKAIREGPSGWMVWGNEPPAGGESTADRLGMALRKGLVDGVRRLGSTLKAIETVLAEVAEEFGGEDPLLPAVRGALDTAAADLGELADGLRERGAPVEIEEPDGDELTAIRQIVHQG